MDLKIKEKKLLLYISAGDILTDCFSPYNAYLLSSHSFDSSNETIYSLTTLDGGGTSGIKEQCVDDIKQLIIGNKLTHYSRREYELNLAKKEEAVK